MKTDYLKAQQEREYQEHLVEEERQRKQWEEEESRLTAERLAKDEARYVYNGYVNDLWLSCEGDEKEYEERLQSFDDWYEEYIK